MPDSPTWVHPPKDILHWSCTWLLNDIYWWQLFLSLFVIMYAQMDCHGNVQSEQLGLLRAQAQVSDMVGYPDKVSGTYGTGFCLVLEWVSELHVPGFPGSSLVSAALACWSHELKWCTHFTIWIFTIIITVFFFFFPACWWYCVHVLGLQWHSIWAICHLAVVIGMCIPTGADNLGPTCRSEHLISSRCT